MTMNEAMIQTLAGLAGGALGVVFFGGLWWTVRKGMSSANPALWFSASMVLRMGVTLAGFYFIGRGNWKRLLFCLLGFLIARLVTTRLTRAPRVTQHSSTEEPSHAS
jgi:F1F0 ATPase subunit 2